MRIATVSERADSQEFRYEEAARAATREAPSSLAL